MRGSSIWAAAHLSADQSTILDQSGNTPGGQIAATSEIGSTSRSAKIKTSQLEIVVQSGIAFARHFKRQLRYFDPDERCNCTHVRGREPPASMTPCPSRSSNSSVRTVRVGLNSILGHVTLTASRVVSVRDTRSASASTASKFSRTMASAPKNELPTRWRQRSRILDPGALVVQSASRESARGRLTHFLAAEINLPGQAERIRRSPILVGRHHSSCLALRKKRVKTGSSIRSTGPLPC